MSKGTAELPLEGAKAGKHKKLDGQVVDERPDPLVVEAARAYADILDQMQRYKDKAPEAYSALQSAFKNSKKKRDLTVTTEWNVWRFRAEQGWKIVKKREQPVK